MVVMAMREQDVGDAHAFGVRQGLDGGDIPGGIDHGSPSAGLIVDQVDEVFHWPEGQCMDFVAYIASHGFLLVIGRVWPCVDLPDGKQFSIPEARSVSL